MLKHILLVFTLYVCMVKCRDLVCRGDLSPSKLFADPKNPHIYHQCKYGDDLGAITCSNDEVFDENLQTCVAPVVSDKECSTPDGRFNFAGNPHKFIVCFRGHAFVFECPGKTVWSESSKLCVDNTTGQTWAP